MSSIRVEVPGTLDLVEVELGEREGVAIGRAPDLAKVAIDGVRLRSHAVIAPSVSVNHAVIWREGNRFHLRDLGSRNGSWLRLRSTDVTDVSAQGELHLRLGFPNVAATRDQPIDVPRYESEAEFGPAIARAVQAWLTHHEIRAVVEATRQTSPSDLVALPLATGEMLLVTSERTVDESFHDLMRPVARYVSAQNAIYAAEQETRSDGMILGSNAIRQVHRRVVEAALQSTPRLVLLGPSGTGKERLANAYHRHLGRTGPLVTVNCATLSRDRIVADLFGSEAGAYTGAQRAIIGAVERADGGTLFLDEVGEMPLDVQSQLLRFLDTGEYQRLGSTGLTRVASVHVVAATNRDLRSMVSAGTFRLDLFFRLALEVIEIPSLRERYADTLAYLATQQLGSCSVLEALDPKSLELVRYHSWPGNFRELINFVRRLPRSAGIGSIDPEIVRRLLDASVGSADRLAPIKASLETDWLVWVQEAANAFCADRAGDGPQTWGDMTAFIEQYLKPYALVHMANVSDARDPEAVVVSKVADAVKADRGTVIKQLRRYFDSKR